MSSPRVVIFNDTHGWHSERLVEALNNHCITAILADLADCQIDLDLPFGIAIPGMMGQLPEGVIVRGISAGSLEQITLRMDILHTLSELGVPVFNSANAIEQTVDKARTSIKLQLTGIATPKTWACERLENAVEITEQQIHAGHSLVLKPLFGCQGKGIIKIDAIDTLKMHYPSGGAYYLQQYIAPQITHQWQDWRLMVIDNQVHAAMSRHAKHWITNFAQGADCFAATVSDQMKQLAIDAVKVIGARYAGVDMIRSRSGQYLILEVNSVPAWKGLSAATGIDIAEILTTTLIKHLNHHVNDDYARRRGH